MSLRVLLVAVISCGLVVGLVAIIDAQVGWVAMLQFWTQVDLPLALAAATLLLLSHCCRAERLFGLLQQPSWRPRRLDVYSISSWHTALNNLLPMRSGEASLPLLIRRRLHRSWSDGVGSLLLIRGLDLLALLWVWAATIVAPVFSPLLLLGWILTTYGAFSAFPWLAGMLPSRIRPPAGVNQLLTRPVRASVLTLAAWLLKFGALLILAQAAVPQSPGIWGSAVLAGELSSISPIHGPAGLGTYEAAFVAPAALGGVSLDAALTVGVNLHVFLLLSSVTLAGLLEIAVTVLSRGSHNAVTGRL